MPRRPRCKSKWSKIIVVNDKQEEIDSFQLDDLGQLENKLKTQTRRRIHEGRRTRKAPSQVSPVSPEANFGELFATQEKDENDPISVDLQNSFEMNNMYNTQQHEMNEYTDFKQIFLFDDSNFFDSEYFDISNIDF